MRYSLLLRTGGLVCQLCALAHTLQIIGARGFVRRDRALARSRRGVWPLADLSYSDTMVKNWSPVGETGTIIL